LRVPVLHRLAALAVALVLIAGRAHADGIGVIATGARDDRTRLTAALVEAIGPTGASDANGPTRIVGDAVGEARAQLLAGAVPAATLVRFRRVREMVDEGWRAYLRVQIDFAHNRLAAARAEAEPLVAFPGGAELYADAALRLGAVLLYRRVPEAQAILALALALDPDRPITVAEFSPDVVEAVDAVRAAPAAFQRVHITCAPAGAIVAIDGKELGRSPLEAQVTRGPHLVVARAPLHHAAVQAIAVGEPARVELALDRDDAAERLSAGAEPGLPAAAEQQLIDAALRFADLDEVVVAAITDRRGGPTLILQRCTGAPARCTAVVEVGFGDRAGLVAAVREAWQAAHRTTFRDSPTVVAESKQRATPTGCRLCRNPLVWTGIGAVVVGTAIAIVIATQSRPPPVLTIDGHDFGH
jgi:hypothetical protein